jgi:hypothetical protein
VLDPASGDVVGVVVETLCRYHDSIAFPEPVEAGLRVERIGTSSVRYELGIFRVGAELASADGHAPRIGYALDGYPIHARVGADGVEPADLDACRGHADDPRGYHYHVAEAGENLFVGCFHGDVVASETGPGGGGGGQPAVEECSPGQTTMCCGDGVCGGPETAGNCATDCA